MTASSPLTVQSVSDSAANFLVTVPSVGFEVCDTCHGRVDPSFANCFGCKQARDEFGVGCADAVAAITLAPKGTQIARHLAYYKSDYTDGAERTRMKISLAGVLWRWLDEHEACLARAAAVRAGRFDVITTVPSTSGRTGDHPLVQVVSQIVEHSSKRYELLLERDNLDVDQREFAADRFRAARPLHGKTVLLVDDTWTTGAHAQSASAALRAAGASRVAILTIGRWMTPGYRDTSDWLQRQRDPWDWSRCCVGRH